MIYFIRLLFVFMRNRLSSFISHVACNFAVFRANLRCATIALPKCLTICMPSFGFCCWWLSDAYECAWNRQSFLCLQRRTGQALDEPTVGLDPRNRRRLIQVLNHLPCAKVIASHDLDFVYDTCQRVILLSDKGVAATGTAEEVLRNQPLLEKHGLELPLSFSRSMG